MSETSTQPTRTLATGAQIPVLGLGVWQVPDGPDCERAVRWAIDCGYRLIDTAQAYGNEVSVGRAIRDSGVPREEIFLTTKFYPARRDPRSEALESLRRLGTEYVDLYLVHWPQGGPMWAWPGTETASAAGLARAVGVSNFSTAEIEQLLLAGSVPPVVNQVQVSPFEYRRSLIQASEDKGLVVQACSPWAPVVTWPIRPSSGSQRSTGGPLLRSSSVGHPEGPLGHHQVGASCSDRGERRCLRLRARPGDRVGPGLP